MIPSQDPLVGTAQQIAPDSLNVGLPSFTIRDVRGGDTIALLHKIASPFRSMSNEDGNMLLSKLCGLTMNANGNGFLSNLRSQMLVSSLERYDGEFSEKSQLLCGPLRQSSVLRMLEFALYRLSNNLLSQDATDDFLRWLIEQQQNGLLASFLKTRMPTVHACATKFLDSVLRLGDADFLELLIDSGIDTSPLKGVSGDEHLTRAAFQGNIRIVQILLKNGADVNGISDYALSSALIVATLEGYAHIVQLLLEAGANVNHLSDHANGDDGCNTALSDAVYRKNLELVHILLAAGANIDICRIAGKSAIKYSALFTDNEDLHQILLSTSKKNYSPITRGGVLEAASTDIQALSQYLAEIGETGLLRQEVLESALKFDEFECEWLNTRAIIPNLLDIGVDPNCSLHNHGGPLRAAVSQGDFELIEILLLAGADVNIPGILISAVKYDEEMALAGTQMLQFMLEAGASIKPHGESAIRYAAYHGYFDAVKFLVLSRVDVNAEAYRKADSEADSEGYGEYESDYIYNQCLARRQTVLYCAVESENLRLVKSLLDMGADFHAISYIYYYLGQCEERTALSHAVSIFGKGSPHKRDIILALLAAGAGVNIPEKRTVLLRAVESIAKESPHKIDIILALLAAGADVNIPEENRTSKSILEAAIHSGDQELISLFLKKGADVNSPPKGSVGRSPIQVAAEMGNLSLIKILLELGADINAPAGIFFFGRTAIQAASFAEFPKMDLIEFLLEAGAEINAPAVFDGGVTALQGAAIQGHMGIARRLLEAGADVNAAGAILCGRTALDGAAEHGRLDMVQMLLNVGAAVDPTKSHRFDRAIELARANGHFAVASLLERA